MSNNAILAALRRMGIGKEEMTSHGFRAMARTILDEMLGFRPDFIEHQLAHAVRDPNGRAYNRTGLSAGTEEDDAVVAGLSRPTEDRCRGDPSKGPGSKLRSPPGVSIDDMAAWKIARVKRSGPQGNWTVPESYL